MNTATQISRYIIHHCNENDVPISNLKLQKLLYYVQGYFYVAFDRPAFPEDIVAWRLGPVVKDVYFQYNSNGPDNLEEDGHSNIQLSPIEKKLLDLIVDQLGCLSASRLVTLTHSEAPWRDVTEDGKTFGAEIPKASIRTFFKSRIAG